MSERIALYPGSFDPITRGHLDILQRACLIFDRVFIGVLQNPSKNPLFTTAERVDLIRQSIDPAGCVEVGTFDGLTVDYAHSVGAVAIVRGLRVTSDFENEFQMTLMNRRLNPDIHTVFLMTSFSNVFISSSIIKEVFRLGGRIDDAVPPACAEALHRKFAKD
ncbi:MAG: pantetheine-phosphate adenylyltransferase [Candidatus Dormibacteraeota bacterium]|nr:pantetheine-phosphate adenylyltransferase [Candidatus Dormibacteraeota bacterium]